MDFYEGARVEVISSRLIALVGETGVIVEIWHDGENCDVRFDNKALPSEWMTSSLGKHKDTRGFSLDRLKIIDDDICDMSEDDMSFILGA